MAIFKNKTLKFSSGKQIKIDSGCIAIRPSMEIAEGCSRQILFSSERTDDTSMKPVMNVFQLTNEEALEVADCIIKIAREFKEQVQKHGVNSNDLFF